MNPQSNAPTSHDGEASSTMSVVLAWLFVGVPLAWGVSQTFIKALALFQ